MNKSLSSISNEIHESVFQFYFRNAIPRKNRNIKFGYMTTHAGQKKNTLASLKSFSVGQYFHFIFKMLYHGKIETEI